MGWIPVNRDENMTCPKSIYARPYDNNDLLKLSFEWQKDTFESMRKQIEEWTDFKKRKNDVLKSSVQFLNTHVLFEWNRTVVFGGTIYANESFPIPWLIVDFDRYMGAPYMVSLGWIPLLIILVGCGLKQPQRGEGKEGADSEDGTDEEQNLTMPAAKRKNKNKNKNKKLIQKIIPTQQRGGRLRTKTPIRITARLDDDYDQIEDNLEDNLDHAQPQQSCPGVCVRRCCCWSCNLCAVVSGTCRYGCRAWICALVCPRRCSRSYVSFMDRYDRSLFRPSIAAVLVCLTLCYGHYYMVSHVYTDVLHGFFIMDPHKEASKYFDTNSGNYMGDLIVLEGQAPIDALYDFASSFGTYGEKYLSTPILRRPRYWNLFRQLCDENKNLDCSRTIPREEMLQDVSVNQHGYKLSLSYLRPLDPLSCTNVTIGVLQTTTCVLESATKFCNLLDPEPQGCHAMMAEQVIAGLTRYQEVLRWDGKQQYRALEVTRDTYNGTIMKKVTKLTRQFAVPCIKGPHKFGSKKAWRRVGRVQKIISMIEDPDERDFYDQPCRVIFGAMCARTKPSGDMLIEQMN